jgi:hypothetical protein
MFFKRARARVPAGKGFLNKSGKGMDKGKGANFK